ncbi:hypothetical protein B566_EDAN016320, partial [Ephemera danica]
STVTSGPNKGTPSAQLKASITALALQQPTSSQSFYDQSCHNINKRQLSRRNYNRPRIKLDIGTAEKNKKNDVSVSVDTASSADTLTSESHGRRATASSITSQAAHFHCGRSRVSDGDFHAVSLSLSVKVTSMLSWSDVNRIRDVVVVTSCSDDTTESSSRVFSPRVAKESLDAAIDEKRRCLDENFHSDDDFNSQCSLVSLVKIALICSEIVRMKIDRTMELAGADVKGLLPLSAILPSYTFMDEIDSQQSSSMLVVHNVSNPVLFNPYINDIPFTESTELAVYADDTANVASSLRADQTVVTLQTHADLISSYCKKWRLKVNASRSYDTRQFYRAAKERERGRATKVEDLITVERRKHLRLVTKKPNVIGCCIIVRKLKDI